MRRTAPPASCLLLALACVFPAGAADDGLDHDALADLMLRRMALEPGERVLTVVGPGRFEELAARLRAGVLRAGGVDLGVRLTARPERGDDAEAAARGWTASQEALTEMFRDVDLAVLLPGAGPADPEYAAVSAVLRRGGRARTIHFHWNDEEPFRSAVAVGGHDLPPQDVIDATYQRAILEADYDGIAALQQRFAAALRTGTVHVTTPLGTDLRFRIGDRAVNLQDGDASAARAEKADIFIDRDVELPCGVVRVAPLEETVEGVIAFPPAPWDGDEVVGLRLHFSRGVVTKMSAASGLDAVEREMKGREEAAKAFRELGLGFHPLLAVPDEPPWIPYYGYGAGVVRLSLGDNAELGGDVRGPYVRWNFFTDATLTVAGRVWVRDGKLTPPLD